jgi:hypothetical protein
MCARPLIPLCPYTHPHSPIRGYRGHTYIGARARARTLTLQVRQSAAQLELGENDGHVYVAADHHYRRRPAERCRGAAGAGGDTDRSRTRLLRGAAGTSYGDFARTRWRSRCAARWRDSYPARPLGSTRRAHRQGDQHSRSGRQSVRARRLLDPERCGAASRRRSADVCTRGRATPVRGFKVPTARGAATAWWSRARFSGFWGR